MMKEPMVGQGTRGFANTLLNSHTIDVGLKAIRGNMVAPMRILSVIYGTEVE